MAEGNVTNQLPPEVWAKIFQHCSLKDLVNIVDVSQQWRDIVIHQRVSANSFVIRNRNDIYDLIRLLRKPVTLSALHVLWDLTRPRRSRVVPQFTVPNPMPTSLTQLHSFSFESTAQYYHKVLEGLLTILLTTSTDTLTHLKLSNIRFTRYRAMNKKVVEVIGACQHLSHLVVNECKFPEEDRRRCVEIIPTLTHLAFLDLRGTRVLDNPVSFIADVQRECPYISNNIMIDWLEVRPSNVSVLKCVSHVTRLFSGDTFFEFNTAQFRSLMSILSERVSRLSVDQLCVTRCGDHMTDDILLAIVRRLWGLTYIDASGCHQLTNEGVVSVITASPHLEVIHISAIQNIDTGIKQLLDHVDTEKDVRISARNTKLSDQISDNSRGRKLYTGKNGNICLEY